MSTFGNLLPRLTALFTATAPAIFTESFALYSTDDDMRQRTWGIYAGFSRHGFGVSDLNGNLNIEIEPMSLLYSYISEKTASLIKSETLAFERISGMDSYLKRK